jgi:hypothetical protein
MDAAYQMDRKGTASAVPNNPLFIRLAPLDRYAIKGREMLCQRNAHHASLLKSAIV